MPKFSPARLARANTRLTERRYRKLCFLLERPNPTPAEQAETMALVDSLAVEEAETGSNESERYFRDLTHRARLALIATLDRLILQEQEAQRGKTTHP
jgi:hypothetical protein